MTSGELMRVLVVDDEAPARQRVIDLLQRDSQIGCVLEAAEGQAAVESILDNRPDLVLLDVQMPELDGLGVVEAIGAAEMPLTVFITAYDQHALRAFEANALDYLLKPFSDERFEGMMTRVRTRLDERSLREFGQRVMKMVSMAPSVPTDAGIGWSSTGRSFRVCSRRHRLDRGGWVYVNLHVAGKNCLPRGDELAEKLDPRRFVRVHRSARNIGAFSNRAHLPWGI